MKFTIDRERWCRGESDPSLLRERDGKMCCLGFFLLACGVAPERIKGNGEPQDAFSGLAEIPPTAAPLIQADWGYDPEECPADENSVGTIPSPVACDLMTVNDDMKVNERDREERIATYFAKIGVDVAFVDAARSGDDHHE